MQKQASCTEGGLCPGVMPYTKWGDYVREIFLRGNYVGGYVLQPVAKVSP